MATTTVTITGTVADILDGDFDARRTKVFVKHNTAFVVDADEGVVRLGSATVAIDSTGAFTLPDVIGSADSVENLQATVYVDYADPMTRTRKTQSFGPYDLSAESGTVDITALEAVQHLDASFVSITTAQFEAMLAQAQVLLDEQISLSGISTTDSAVAGLFTSSLFGPLTRAAADKRYAPGYSVTGNGADNTGTTDASTAIRAASTAAAAFGADLYFPAGTYLVSRVNSGTAYALGIPAGQRWYGPGTIKLAASQLGTTRLLNPLGAGVVVDGLTLDGNASNQGASTDQRHGIFVNYADCAFRNVTVQNCDGDGIALSAGADRARVVLSTIKNNLRSGISIVNAFDGAMIAGNWITGNSATPIDGEVNTGHADNVCIQDNRLEASSTADLALTLAGASGSYNEGWIVSGNTLLGGVNFNGSSGARFTDNTVVGSGSVLSAAVYGSRCLDVLVKGNRITMTGTNPGILFQTANSQTPIDVQILDNRIKSTKHAVHIQGANGVMVHENICSATGTATGAGILVEASVSMYGVSVRNNQIRNYLTYAVQLTMSGASTLSEVIVRDNICIDDQGTPTMTTALRISGTASQYSNIFFAGDVIRGGVTNFVSDNTTGGPIGYGITRNGRYRETQGTAAPTTGTWSIGDRCWNTSPVPGGNIGWVCTTGGSPGTWKTFGVVDLSKTTSFNFPSIAAGTTAELTTSLTGAAVGDRVTLGAPSTIEAGLVWNGYVSAADVVTIRVANVTTGAIDPASASWSIKITK